jgi:hypothetical protein
MKMENKIQWVDPNQWVQLYGEIISKSRAAKLIGKSAPHITALLHDGSLEEFRHGISVRQLAELQLIKRVNAVKKGKPQSVAMCKGRAI